MKRSLPTILAVLALLATLPAAHALATTTITPAPVPFLTTAGPATTILAEYPLRGGRLLANFKRPGHVGWAVVLPGTQIGQEPLTLGGEVRDTLTIRPPEPRNGAEARVAAQELTASGWTEDVQLALFDLVGNGTPALAAIDQIEPQRSSAAAEGDPNPDKEHFAEGCAQDTLDTNDIQARGCYQRFWGQENEYEAFTGSTSWAYGKVTNPRTSLTIVTTAHTYGNPDATMRDYNPMSTIHEGSCSTVGLSLSGYGLTVSQSQQICPETLDPTISEDGHIYGVDWRGSESEDARHTQLVEMARLYKGSPPTPYPAQAFGFAYHMDFRVEHSHWVCNVPSSSLSSPSDECDPAYTAKKVVYDALKG